MATMQELFPQYGGYNEHWNNHPAGLPVSQYQGNTNPNSGVAAYNAALKKLGQTGSLFAPKPPPKTTTPTTTTPKPTTPTTTTPTTTTPTTTVPTTTTPTGGMTSPQGFAARYTPAMMNQVYENPWSILPDVYEGMSMSSPMYQALRDMGADPLTLFNVTKGAQGINTAGGPEFINWLADMYGERGKVGGKNFDVKDMVNQIFGQTKFGADAPNSLGQILGAGDMSTQVRTLFNLLKDVSNVSMNPLSAKAYQSAMQQAGDQYQSEMLKTPAGEAGPVNPSEWIKQHFPDLTMGLQ
jgi:hypothetical protein